ncbi:hypothetical protein AK812_SmicGene43848 [Symbiodinium microadriaticum]|uniref:Uncharacterized protein n=1 Tax=Symbiodinium microadriaticum TaxID=2951 RepID=A0A1Q9BZZ7_SYMMI|nr:hypothetical protein AK812_SmicGene43848 [Symbiodinium microadriaticum]
MTAVAAVAPPRNKSKGSGVASSGVDLQLFYGWPWLIIITSSITCFRYAVTEVQLLDMRKPKDGYFAVDWEQSFREE